MISYGKLGALGRFPQPLGEVFQMAKCHTVAGE